ncbi:MAG TPA: DUF2141 domain-containing protein [Saprospiraceae bacterium]|nr:DUF2141 domain-containing protein [Saprospiraceae bacterium]HMP26097.1 DUF2141 domain-containing protein [Saprospiraceae bacterium]
MQITNSLLVCCALLCLSSTTFAQGTLTVRVTNVEVARGSIYIAVYQDEAAFLREDEPFRGEIIPVTSLKDYTASIAQLPFGKYAIAVFHDSNGNGRLDKNSFGIPTEPYAFSNNPTAKWRRPTFAEMLITIGESRQDITVELRRWRNH